MQIMIITIVALSACLLIGCDAKTEKNNKAPQGVIMEPQLRALEKAQGVEKTLLDAEEARNKSME